jgi:hypothetical protein
VHCVALVVLLYWPAEQAAQLRSVFAVEGIEMKVPGWQVVYAVHATAVLPSGEYVLAGQAEHTGGDVVVGWVEAY